MRFFMSFRTKRVILSTFLVMIYEFFLMKYLFLLFGGLDDICLLLLTILFGILNMVPMFFEEKKSRPITRLLDTISGFWIWMSLFYLFVILIIYIGGVYIDWPFYIIVILVLLVPLLTVYSYFHAHKIIIHERTIQMDNINEDINIAHLSDVHFGSTRHDKIIRDLSDKLKELSDYCDLAIISGDLVDGSCAIEEDDFLPLKDVNMPIVFTPGNHDSYLDIEDVFGACRNAGIIVLDDDGMEFGNLNIFGMTFIFGMTRKFEEFEVVSTGVLGDFVKEDKVNIIIFHVPKNWEDFSKLGFDIQLSGHTHGGQFHPLTWICDLIWYNRGLFKANVGGKDRHLHVTTGVGSMDYPFRWGTDSEIVVLKLRKKD